MCVSAPVFNEYIEVLQREKFRRYPGFSTAAIVLLEKIKKNGFWCDPKISIDILEDKDDNKFIELAVEANAALIITGNSGDFVIKTYRDISICSPKEFYEIQFTR